MEKMLGKCFIEKENNSLWECTWEDEKLFTIKTETMKATIKKEYFKDFLKDFKEVDWEEE